MLIVFAALTACSCKRVLPCIIIWCESLQKEIPRIAPKVLNAVGTIWGITQPCRNMSGSARPPLYAGLACMLVHASR